MSPFDFTSACIFVDPYGHDTNAELAIRLGIGVESVIRAKRRGAVELHVAERIAHHIGVHPCTIWPAYYDVTIAMADKADACRKRAADRKRAKATA